MAPKLERLRYHSSDPPSSDRSAKRSALRSAAGHGPQGAAFRTDEDAARYYLDALVDGDARPTVRSLRRTDDGPRMPSLTDAETIEMPVVNSRLVRFRQRHGAFPIFGAHAFAELDRDRRLVSSEAHLGRVEGISSEPNLKSEQALARVQKVTGSVATLADIGGAELVFYHDGHADARHAWSLAWHLKGVPGAPPSVLARTALPAYGHGLAPSPRVHRVRTSYLVDAHRGDVLFYYGAAPGIDVPVLCSGEDEDGVRHEFRGRRVADGVQLEDPMRVVRTLDMSLRDVDTSPPPEAPLQAISADWGADARAAVAAHVNAARVYDFFNSIVQRHGIDGAGGEIVSVVNCTYAPSGEGNPVWTQAEWFQGKMWYGQTERPDGSLVSMARFLEIAAHELTHGLTASTARLVYRDQPGALDESFSDIFGILIRNWYLADNREDVRTWSWEIGAGLRGALPLRDLSDPGLHHLPSHMDDWHDTPEDYGGVHTNSAIHNKAAYLVLNARTRDGRPLFRVTDVAVLYYHALLRLHPLASFSDALRALLDVAATYYSRDSTERDERVDALTNIYAGVGITS